MSHADQKEYGRWEVHIPLDRPLDRVKNFDEHIKGTSLILARTSLHDTMFGHQLYEFADDTDVDILGPTLDKFFAKRT